MDNKSVELWLGYNSTTEKVEEKQRANPMICSYL